MRRQGLQNNRPFIYLSIALWALASGPAIAQQQGIRWQADLEAAKAQAKQTGRLVLIHFWTPHCGPCENLERTVLNQPAVAAAIEAKFVPVRLNANENTATAQGFGITRVPTDVVLTPDGQVVSTLVSPPTPDAYVAELSQVADQHAARSQSGLAQTAPIPPPRNAAYAALQVDPRTPPAIGDTADTSAEPSDATTPNAGPTVTPGVAAIPAASGDRPPRQSPLGFAAPPLAQSHAAPPATNPTGQPAAPVASTAPPQSPTAATALPDPTALPAGAPPLGFEGYCPVSMRNHWKWVPGDPRWGVIHRGRTFWFAGEAEQQQFWGDPDRYSPALSGMDPVLVVDHNQHVPGKREHAIDYDNLFYMFASEATLARFAANPERYATDVRQAMGIPRGRLVR